MYLGLAMALGLLSGMLWPLGVLAQALAGGALICFVGALLALPGLIKERFNSRYDIKSLIELQEREELRRIELDESQEYDSVHCLACGEVYNIKLPICPRCGSAPGRPGSG